MTGSEASMELEALRKVLNEALSDDGDGDVSQGAVALRVKFKTAFERHGWQKSHPFDFVDHEKQHHPALVHSFSDVDEEKTPTDRTPLEPKGAT